MSPSRDFMESQRKQNKSSSPPPIFGSSDDDEIYGTSFGDTIYAGDGYDTIFAMDGNDVVFGEADDDYVSGGEGDDIIYGGDGYDALEGDDGNDQIFGGNDDDYLNGLDGDDVLEGGDGDDYIYGGLGNDTLSGGAGSLDYLMGEEGDDTYVISLDSGSVEIDNYNYGSTGDNDIIKFSEGIDSTDVSVSRDGADLLLDRVGTTDTVRILDFYVDQTSTEINTQISVEFSDQTVWDTNQLNEFVYPPMQSMSFTDWSQEEWLQFEEFAGHGFSKKGSQPAFNSTDSLHPNDNHLNKQLYQLVSAIAAFDAPKGVGEMRIEHVTDSGASFLAPHADLKCRGVQFG